MSNNNELPKENVLPCENNQEYFLKSFPKINDCIKTLNESNQNKNNATSNLIDFFLKNINIIQNQGLIKNGPNNEEGALEEKSQNQNKSENSEEKNNDINNNGKNEPKENEQSYEIKGNNKERSSSSFDCKVNNENINEENISANLLLLYPKNQIIKPIDNQEITMNIDDKNISKIDDIANFNNLNNTKNFLKTQLLINENNTKASNFNEDSNNNNNTISNISNLSINKEKSDDINNTENNNNESNIKDNKDTNSNNNNNNTNSNNNQINSSPTKKKPPSKQLFKTSFTKFKVTHYDHYNSAFPPEELNSSFSDSHYRKKRKFKPDDIRKKIKSRFHKTLKKIVNENLRKAGSKYEFDFLPQYFISSISREKNQEVLDLTYNQILAKDFVSQVDEKKYKNKNVDFSKIQKNKKVLEYLKSNPVVCKKSGFDLIGNMKYSEILEEYFLSEEFEKSLIKLREENEEEDYIKEYRNKAKNYVKFFQQRPKKKIDCISFDYNFENLSDFDNEAEFFDFDDEDEEGDNNNKNERFDYNYDEDKKDNESQNDNEDSNDIENENSEEENSFSNSSSINDNDSLSDNNEEGDEEIRNNNKHKLRKINDNKEEEENKLA